MIGIYGASGFIGQHLFNFFQSHNEKVIGTYNSNKKPNLVAFDVTKDSPALFDPCSVVVVAGAISEMAACIDDPEYAYAINVDGIVKLTRYFNEKKIKLIFLSSNQVFSGKMGAYTEEDVPEPKTTYGKQKLQGERVIQQLSRNYLILRLSKVYSINENVDSLYSQIARQLRDGLDIEAAYNQIYNPTEIGFLCEMIRLAIKCELEGVYHLATHKAMSRYEFAKAVARKIGVEDKRVVPVDIMIFPLVEYPPRNGSILSDKIICDLNKCAAVEDLPKACQLL